MQRLSYPTETVLSNKIARNRIVLSFKDSPRKPLGRRPHIISVRRIAPSFVENNVFITPRKRRVVVESTLASGFRDPISGVGVSGLPSQ